MKYKFYTTHKSAWDGMKAELNKAQRSIYLESYIFLDDTIGRQFVDILVKKATAGLDVKLILDGVGSFWFSVHSIKRLKSAGVHVLAFQDLVWKRIIKSFRRLFHRNHRKTLIIDKKVGFIGGVNIKEAYADWLDLHLMVVGEEAVAPMVRSFGKTWVLGGGKRITVRSLIDHPIKRLSTKVKHLTYVFSHPYKRFKERSRIRKAYIDAMHSAKRIVRIVTPYFLPDKKLLGVIKRTISRGVKVELLVPLKHDEIAVQHAMHALFPELHTMGIELLLYPNMMHGKAMIVDHKLGMVGSSNFDSRSFFYNHEASLFFTNQNMITDLKKIVDKWKNQAHEFILDGWDERPLIDRVLRRVASWFSPIL